VLILRLLGILFVSPGDWISLDLFGILFGRFVNGYGIFQILPGDAPLRDQAPAVFFILRLSLRQLRCCVGALGAIIGRLGRLKIALRRFARCAGYSVIGRRRRRSILLDCTPVHDLTRVIILQQKTGRFADLLRLVRAWLFGTQKYTDSAVEMLELADKYPEGSIVYH
jgi:hypothetical protein